MNVLIRLKCSWSWIPPLQLSQVQKGGFITFPLHVSRGGLIVPNWNHLGAWVISVQKCWCDAVGHSIISRKVNWLQVEMLPNDILRMLVSLRFYCLYIWLWQKDNFLIWKTLIFCQENTTETHISFMIFTSLG